MTAPASRLPGLPQPLTSLIGREREVAAVKAMLQQDHARLITLTGPGGTGKTRLAIQVATELSGSYRDGVWFVSLAPLRDPDLVMSAIAQTLGVRDSADHPLITSLTSALRDRHLLIVLDNVEQVVSAAPLFSELLGTCAELSMLVTSRTPLHLYGERAIAVMPLTVPNPTKLPSVDLLERVEAVRLFVTRAQAAQSTFALNAANARAIAAICVRLDGLPLAIELAAARVQVLSPQALAERLDRRLPLLVDGPRDVPARQQTLRATIAWSYDLLRPDEQRMFRRLSILKGGWTIETAEALVMGAGVTPVDGISSLTTLIEHGLIHAHESPVGSLSYTMLETIREFGIEQLDLSGEGDAAHRQHLNYQLRLFSDSERDWHTPLAEDWRQRGEAEIENVRLALEWAIIHDPETGLRLARSFSWIWFVHGAVPESQHWLVQGLASAGDVPRDLRADVLWWIGANATTLGEYSQARAALDEALAIYGDLGNDIGAANCLHGLGRIAQFADDSNQAVILYESAADLFRHRRTPRLMVTLSNMGSALIQSDEPDRAIAVLDEALKLAERQGLPWHRAQILGTQASLALARGDLRGARQVLRHAVELNRDAGDPRFIAQALETCAWLATAEGAIDHAVRLLGAVDFLREMIGIPIPPSTRREYDRHVPRTRTRVSPTDWDRAWTEGRALSQAEAIDLALNGLTEPPTRSPMPVLPYGSLSAREMDVLRLLVEGLSDREIAVELFISPRTVGVHVSHILGKLGVESRTAAATYAVRHNLA